MCGIAGYYHHRSGRPVSQTLLERMARTIAHRGPDGQGLYCDGPIGLAHRRLAIIDIEGGSQPMSDDSVWLSYNGEVYNYLELREELSSRGHLFHTRSDTEVVLKAYREWGLDFATHFNGMFAIALWDAAERRLILCRDRLGIKPLYYATTDDGTAFASEPKALHVVPGVDTEFDLEALDEFMTCGYVIRPRTLLRGMRKVEPGTLMVFEADRAPTTHRYWQLSFQPNYQRTRIEWCERIRDALTESVRLRLRSDVPLGVLLSGGLDSTLIASTMKRIEGGLNRIDSFCVGVDIPGATNEFAHARRVASDLGLEHHELRLTADQFASTLLEAAGSLDEPLVEPMVGQLLAVCRYAREQVKVVLSGEGADETWFGYPSYRLHALVEMVQSLFPLSVLASAVRLVESAAGYVQVPPKLIKHARNLAEPLERRYLGLNYFDIKMKDSLYRPEVRRALRDHDSREVMRSLYANGAGGPEPISRMAAVDCRAWLVDNTLLRSDFISMAASLELRVPFLDHCLVELAATVPARFKVRATDQKVILKEATKDRLPKFVAKRRKAGFPTPLKQLFEGSFGEVAAERFRHPAHTTAALFDYERILSLYDAHRSGSADYSKLLFQMLMLEYWATNQERAR